jgi:exonuclease III
MYKIVYCIFIIVGLWIAREKFTISYHQRLKHTIPTNTIITYNIQRMPLSTKPLKKLYDMLKPYSIILLQECFLNLLYDDIQYTFHDYNIVKGTMSGYRLSNSGLVILSRYPIVSYKFIPFKNNSYLSSDILAEKGFLVTTIDINQQKVHIINTHLQSNTYRDDYVIAQKQWNELHEYLKRLNDPWIIGGDFNMPFLNMTSPYKLFGPTHPTIYIKYNNNIEQNTSCYKKDTYEPFIFDYFIAKDMDLSTPIPIEFEYSDHLPVVTKFDFF